MRELSVELDKSTFEALEVERKLTGFESRAAYVQWIIEHRGSSSDESDGNDRLLEAYRRRIAVLEQRLESEMRSTDSGSTTHEARAKSAPSSDAGSASADTEAHTSTNDDPEEPAQNNGWRRWRGDPTIKVRGRPRTTVHRDQTAEETAETEVADDRDRDDELNTGRHCDASTEVRSTGNGATTLAPERVVRISEDPVADDADILETVEIERVDELSRRAVAKTRKQLDRDVETGLDYQSTTTFTSEDVRPGEDLVDLETIPVPGRSEQRIAQRRAVAGRAIAFLRDETEAQRSDFVDHLYEEHPAGYATAEGWWSFLKGVFRQVDVIDGGNGAHVWRYVG